MKKLFSILLLTGLISCTTIKNNYKTNEMKLTPELIKITEHLQKIQVFDAQNEVDMSRKGYETMAVQLNGKKEAVKTIEEFNIPQKDHQIPLRMYKPNGSQNEKSSAIIYLHGGWFVSGSFETHDSIVRKLANATGSIIVFIDYRLAPEFPFPAGFEDCISTVEWIIKNAENLNIDKSKIGIIGDSAGGALAASISTQLGDQLKFQVLIYPAADNKLNTQSWKDYENGPIINKEEGIRAWNWYLPQPENQANPVAIPILIKNFKHTPPTLVLLAEHDPLKDEGQQLANNMEAFGINVKIVFYKDMVHGFMHMGSLKEAKLATDEIATFVKENLR
ncbi:alpha/beta hydrolase [Chryseobacterium sp.]|uniref:alpha/beta hydrolase n=1 Tax=Chryseobacterium sp. TaxID=1871047 RepID=UPI0025C4F8F1|nr:alpha/beta hydrolase [Chryseobacterium sp.]